ncbi:MAG: Thiosulfate sulfurtransferase GlpE [Pseudomonadota bacterium]|jgi:rhodanese-related sulfurtransferase
MLNQITPAQLNDWAAQQASTGPLIVLDVREPWELQTASVTPAGFELLSIPMQQVPARLSELDRTRPVACLCHHGSRSMQVASFLVQQGFEHVANIAGGIHAWSSQVDPAVPTY